MQTAAPFYQKCAISRTMKSQGRSALQYNAKQDLILISKRNFSCSCNLDGFCERGMAILQTKFGFFLAFNPLRTARANRLARAFLVITRQLL